MLGARCQNHTNKKTSTYQCLKTQPLNFQHSFHFTAKIGFSKCHPVAKNSRGENSSEIWIVYFKDEGTWLLLASTPKGRACNLSRTANLESEVGQHAGKVSWVSPQVFLVFAAASRSDLLLLTLWNRATIIIPSLGLSGRNKSFRPHLFCVVTLLSFDCRQNDRRKMSKARVWHSLSSRGCSITSLCCSSWCFSVSCFVWGKHRPAASGLVGWGWRAAV